MTTEKEKIRSIALTEETFRKAEDLCAALSQSLYIDQRRPESIYPGILVDLEGHSAVERQVLIADPRQSVQLVIISSEKISDINAAIVTYSPPNAPDIKLKGRVGKCRQTLRSNDPRHQYLALFDVTEDFTPKLENRKQ